MILPFEASKFLIFHISAHFSTLALYPFWVRLRPDLIISIRIISCTGSIVFFWPAKQDFMTVRDGTDHLSIHTHWQYFYFFRTLDSNKLEPNHTRTQPETELDLYQLKLDSNLTRIRLEPNTKNSQWSRPSKLTSHGVKGLRPNFQLQCQ